MDPVMTVSLSCAFCLSPLRENAVRAHTRRCKTATREARIYYHEHRKWPKESPEAAEHRIKVEAQRLLEEIRRAAPRQTGCTQR